MTRRCSLATLPDAKPLQTTREMPPRRWPATLPGAKPLRTTPETPPHRWPATPPDAKPLRTTPEMPPRRWPATPPDAKPLRTTPEMPPRRWPATPPDAKPLRTTPETPHRIALAMTRTKPPAKPPAGRTRRSDRNPSASTVLSTDRRGSRLSLKPAPSGSVRRARSCRRSLCHGGGCSGLPRVRRRPPVPGPKRRSTFSFFQPNCSPLNFPKSECVLGVIWSPPDNGQ
jgi:hypothetical protein